MKKPNKHNTILNLYKEFKILEKGKEVQLNIFPKLNNINIPVHINWESELNGEYSYDDNHFIIINKITSAIESSIKPHLANFNKQIALFIKKCDTYANVFGEDENMFFQNMIDYGSKIKNKKLLKSNLQKEIKSTKLKLANLNKQITNI